MKHFVTIDTCAWLNLTLERGDEVFDALEKLMDNGKLELVHPEVVFYEFERNKETRAKDYSKIVRNEIKSIKELLKRFDIIEGSEKAKAHEVLDKIADAEKEVKKLVTERIDRISKIVSKSTCKKIEITNEIYKKVVERGLKKEAPFRSKNSTADALIIEIFALNAKRNDGNNYYFVTANKWDFANSKDERKPHTDIEAIFSSPNIFYEINIAELLNKIEKESISEAVVEQVAKWPLKDYFLYSCPNCGKELENGLSAHPSQFGWTYWAICSMCGCRWNTGEPIDD